MEVETEAGKRVQVDRCLGGVKAFLDQVIRHLPPASERPFRFALVNWAANSWDEEETEEAMELLSERLVVRYVLFCSFKRFFCLLPGV